MIRFTNLLFLLACFALVSCEDDENCGENAQVDGDCFKAVLVSYSTQTYGADGDSRENLFISFQYTNGSERYQLPIRSGKTANNGQVDTFRFTEGEDYSGNSLYFNGDINNPATGNLVVTFTKVDRENGLISATFTWVSAQGGGFNGKFSDVKMDLVAL
ncbi:hypothetical protein [Marinoscillum furvescens]|uniref:Uncharacterized protein n=1 Tax=Marinoscillum furvescens DSM 4134 TaxID=1122208 RepID=A0A3D9L1A2_MARFU|nr:hypothetical protein [Marinoscillum furvescens]RED97525.1 hypothetical protein C7460_112135 [Marinoscillum furvescens DSM 4134]